VICAFRRNPSDIALTLKPSYKNLAPFVRLQETGVEALEICHHCRSFTTNRQIFFEYPISTCRWLRCHICDACLSFICSKARLERLQCKQGDSHLSYRVQIHVVNIISTPIHYSPNRNYRESPKRLWSYVF
jgi:hypothetical protein